MKRFLIASLFCLIPFTAKADGSLSGLTDFVANQLSSTLPRIFDSVDSSLRSCVDKEDYQTIVDSGAAFYYSSFLNPVNLLGYAAAYDPQKHDVLINAFFDGNQIILQELIHHEVQHLKDYARLKEKGYNPETITTDLDKTSQMMLGAILEARAYIEQAVFAYSKREDLLNKVKDLDKNARN